MKHMKKYFALLLTLLLCLTALWGCGEKEPQQPENGGETVEENPFDEEQQATPLSDTIECSNGSRTLRFRHNEQGQWEWKDDPEFPLDASYVEELQATVEAMMTLQPITTDKSLKSLDLEDSDTSKYVTVSDEKGESVTWYLGKKDDNGRHYMRLDGDESGAIYLSPADLSAQISRSIYAMMELPQLPAIAQEGITSLTVQFGDATRRFHTDAEGRWLDEEKINVTAKMQTLLDQLAAPAVAACVDFKPSKGAPAICGLDKPAAILTVEYVNILDVASTFTLFVGNTREDGYLVTINDDTTIYQMDAPLVTAVLAFGQ